MRERRGEETKREREETEGMRVMQVVSALARCPTCAVLECL